MTHYGELNPSYRHGHDAKGKRSHEYNSWASMCSRCNNPHDDSFAYYGGSGITVHAAWCGRGGFERFLADVGRRPGDGYSLDRFPNREGNYEPGNVRWATKSQQMRNKRSSIVITINGETMHIKEWCERTGVPYQTAWQRIRKQGWDKARAVTEPPTMSRFKYSVTRRCVVCGREFLLPPSHRGRNKACGTECGKLLAATGGGRW